ncbi:MAG: dihydroxyacetone kinase subunit DhaL [Planctomycetota bacterium]|nr:dihydroxyacetone kinase subunit DhaL [Planctomycetota bacterium]
MTTTLDRAGLIRCFRGAAEQVRANHALLSQLDSVGGDGDHGTTMLRAMTCLEQAMSASTVPQVSGLLSEIGWAVMGVDGGATGPLFGSFFQGMSDPAAGKDVLDAATLAAMLEAGLASVQRQSKAKMGDKTMLDALIPAVQAARRAADAGADLAGVFGAAATAAQQGAEATQQLQAKFGRARNIGAKSIGTADPGATSVSLVFRGFLEGATTHA